MLAKKLELIGDQIVHQAVKDVAGLRLARMHPSCENNNSLEAMMLNELEQLLIEVFER